MAKVSLDELGAALTRTAQDFSEKAGAMVERSTMRGKLAHEERQLTKVLACLGKAVYEKRHEGGVPEDEMAALCERIKEREEKIDRLNQEMAASEHKKICPVCKKTVGEDFVFCSYCGTKFSEKAEEPQEDEDQIDEEEVFQEAEAEEGEMPQEPEAEEPDDDASEEASSPEE